MFNINHKETRKKCNLRKETKLSFPELEKCELVNCIPVVIILPCGPLGGYLFSQFL